MLKLLASPILAMALAQAGCATLFTSSTTRITIETTPPGAAVMAIGGTAGDLIVTLKRASAVTQKILDWLTPHFTPEGKAELQKLSFEELLTWVIAWLEPHVRNLAPMADKIRQEFDKIPLPIAQEIRAFLGLDRFGVSPLTCTVKNGNSYAVIAFQQGHRAAVGSLGTRINMAMLWNAFNGFLLLPIDFLTGKWRVTGPERLHLTLTKVN